MKTSKYYSRTKDNVSYGLMAVNTLNALENITSGQNLTEEASSTLQLAADFMLEIANGVNLVTEGRYSSGHSAISSMRTLDVVKGPIENLKHVANIEDRIAEQFRGFGDLLQKYACTDYQATDKDREDIHTLITFFNSLNSSLFKADTKEKYRKKNL